MNMNHALCKYKVKINKNKKYQNWKCRFSTRILFRLTKIIWVYTDSILYCILLSQVQDNKIQKVRRKGWRWIIGFVFILSFSGLISGLIRLSSGKNNGIDTIESDNRKVYSGLDSPYRYDCKSVVCSPLDEYVWRDNNHWSYNETIVYGSLVGPRPVKTFVMNMTSQKWLTGSLTIHIVY